MFPISNAVEVQTRSTVQLLTMELNPKGLKRRRRSRGERELSVKASSKSILLENAFRSSSHLISSSVLLWPDFISLTASMHCCSNGM